MVMWKIKSCPRCGGDLFLDIEEQTWLEHCLQCGYIRQKSDTGCPFCGKEMSLDMKEGRELYHCHHCGRTAELNSTVG